MPGRASHMAEVGGIRQKLYQASCLNMKLCKAHCRGFKMPQENMHSSQWQPSTIQMCKNVLLLFLLTE
jgi:hypothetical protein